MRTAGQFLQDTPVTDGQIFLGASRFVDIAALAARANPSLGLYDWSLGATHACTFVTEVGAMLRTGTAPNYQEQFGTAASVPGPSAVSGTSDPLGLQGFPPILAANLPTIKGPVTGYLPKGVQINSMDVIYSFLTNDGTVATAGITKTSFVNAVAPAVTAILAIANNGLVLTAQATPYVKNIAVVSPTFVVSGDTEVLINVNLTSGAGGGAFYGVVLNVSYNWN